MICKRYENALQATHNSLYSSCILVQLAFYMQDKHGLLTTLIAITLRTMIIQTIFAMVVILMFNLVDTFFVSQLGTQALVAVSFTFPVTLPSTASPWTLVWGFPHVLGGCSTRAVHKMPIALLATDLYLLYP